MEQFAQHCKQGHLQCDNISKSGEIAVHIADNIAIDNTATYYAHYYLFAYSAYLRTWCMPSALVTCTRGSLVAKERRPC